MMTLLLVLLILMLVGGLPPVGVVNYGYGPSGLAFVLLVVLIVLLATGRLNL